MSEQYPGGFITKTAPTVDGSTAKGMWTLSQAAGFKKQGLWPTIPGAPTIGTATAGNASASVAFTAPSDIGSSAITSYTATSSPGGFTGTGASSPVTVSGLTNDTAYTFTVTATNGAGTGPSSAASNSVTPVLPAFMANLYPGSAQSVVTDSSNNIYVLGWDSSNQYVTIGKYTNAGVLVWQKRTDVANAQYNRIAIDSSGNLAVATVGSGQQRLFKYDSDGNLTWQRYLSGWPSGCSGVNVESGAGVCFDSSGNVYVSSPVYYACLYGYAVTKFNSSGTRQWSRTFTNNVRSYQYTNIAADSAGNIYFTTGQASCYYRVILVKLNSSDGTTAWNRQLYTPCNYPSSYGQDLAIDSSNNIYVTGLYGNNSFVAKFDSSGTNQWTKSMSFGAPSYGYGVGVDTSGNVYVTGHYLFDYKMFMIKLNSSGTEQWQRHLTANTSGWKSYGYDAHVDSGGNPVFVATLNESSNNRMLIMKPPADGSKTGTYTLSGVSWTYGASSASISTASPTITSGGPSNSSIGLSASTPSYSVSTGSLTTGTTTL